MQKYFRIDKDWGFTKALDEINQYYRPGGIGSGPARNVHIENWGLLVGRTRALAEIELAIEEHRTKTNLCDYIHMSNSTLNRLIDFFKELPDDSTNNKVQQGTSISAHFLMRQVGKGGNAVVWKVRKSDGTTCVMKVVKKPKGIALTRFNDEIGILKKINTLENSSIHVIPIIDSYTQLEDDNFAWYTMPEATPLEKYITDTSPSILSILKGLLDICITVEALHKEKIYHRDIKPNNFLLYKKKWYLGDFGIATFPNKNNVTKEGAKLGSLHFYAPEMLSNTNECSGEHADVYSFSKTMWVLLSGQKYPLGGELRLDREEALLSTFCSFKNISLLDEIISLCTSHIPTNRPTMAIIRSYIQKVIDNA